MGGAITIFAVIAMTADFVYAPAETPEGLRLGRSYLTDDSLSAEDIGNRLDEIGYERAQPFFAEALKRDPGSSRRWSDYGEALVMAGELQNATYSYNRALKLAPHDVATLYEAADFHATHGYGEQALDAFAILLRELDGAGDQVMIRNVFTYLEGLRFRQNRLLDKAIPNAGKARAYLKYLTQNEVENKAAAVEETWNWLAAKGYADDALAAHYSGFMLSQNLPRAAASAWRDHFRERHDGYPDRNLIFNGGFEFEPVVPAVLDWRAEVPATMRAQRDQTVKFEGKFSYRLIFNGNDNPDFRGLANSVILQPGKYRLTAHIKTAGITSDEGVRLRVTGGVTQVRAETAAVSGTTDWTAVSTDFEVTPATPVLEIQVARKRSIRIDNSLKGTAWIDAVSVTRG